MTFIIVHYVIDVMFFVSKIRWFCIYISKRAKLFAMKGEEKMATSDYLKFTVEFKALCEKYGVNGYFNVSQDDNGCGFDPDDHPGIMQGHFGLQGIRERVMRFGGKIEIASAPGKGTKVTISIQTTHR